MEKAYLFDLNNKEYKAETFVDVDFQGNPLLPDDTTVIPPREAKEGFAVCFNGIGWEYKEDHRKEKNGKPYFNPQKFWWAEAQYMSEIGPYPSGVVFEKMAKPEICNDCREMMNQVLQDRQYLKDTDYIHSVLSEEPEKADYYAEKILERKRIRPTIDVNEAQITKLKEQIKEQYGEEALLHL